MTLPQFFVEKDPGFVRLNNTDLTESPFIVLVSDIWHFLGISSDLVVEGRNVHSHFSYSHISPKHCHSPLDLIPRNPQYLKKSVPMLRYVLGDTPFFHQNGLKEKLLYLKFLILCITSLTVSLKN